MISLKVYCRISDLVEDRKKLPKMKMKCHKCNNLFRCGKSLVDFKKEALVCPKCGGVNISFNDPKLAMELL